MVRQDNPFVAVSAQRIAHCVTDGSDRVTSPLSVVGHFPAMTPPISRTVPDLTIRSPIL